jgi:class 3 adenylate cyclase
MTTVPEVRYARSGDVSIAYQVLGEGPIDLVFVPFSAGLHTGECELHDGKLAGIAVSVGARVAAEARPGQVVVSRTVRDLVAESGIEFEDIGERPLKGVPGEWNLIAVRP